MAESAIQGEVLERLEAAFAAAINGKHARAGAWPAQGIALGVQTALRDAGRARGGAHSSNPSANDTAAAASFILRDVKRVMRSPMLLLGTVCRLSKLAAQV